MENNFDFDIDLYTGYNPQNTHIEARKNEANEFNCDLIIANNDTLLLDLDTPESVNQFEAMYAIFQKQFGLSLLATWRSKSGNTHMMLSINPPRYIFPRLIIQAILGDDPKHVAVTLLQYEKDSSAEVVLFKPK